MDNYLSSNNIQKKSCPGAKSHPIPLLGGKKVALGIQRQSTKKCSSSAQATWLVKLNGNMQEIIKKEAAIGFEPMMEDLQSSALPLGYAAITLISKRSPQSGKSHHLKGCALDI